MDLHIQRFYPMGTQTLTMLILRRCFSVIIFVLILLFLLGVLFFIPKEYVDIALYAFLVYLVFVILFSIFAVFLGWLEYHRYEITLGDKSLKLQRGLISVEQVGIPYRYIQDIKIERTLLDQIIGVSDLIVTTSGSEQQEINPDESSDSVHRIILPAVEDKIGRQIQEIVLNRAQIQQIDITK